MSLEYLETSVEDVTYNDTRLTKIKLDDTVIWEQPLFYNLLDDGSGYSVTLGDPEVAGVIAIADTFNGKTVVAIEEQAFKNAASITGIIVPDSITSIGDNIFVNCDNLASVYYKGTASNWSNITIGNSNEGLTNTTIYYYSEEHPTESGSFWCYEDGVIAVWHDSLVIDEAVAADCTNTGLTAGKHCSECGEILVAQEVVPALGHNPRTIIGKLPTCTETGLTSGSECSRCGRVLTPQTIIMPLGHTPSDTWTTTVSPTLNSTGTKVKYCTVCGDIAETATIPKLDVLAYSENSDGTLSVMATAKGISSNTDLDGVIFIPSEYEGKAVTSIATSGFDECVNIKSITIPDSITDIGSWAFRGCSSLARVVIGNGVASIGQKAFEDCSKLTDIVIPTSVTSIGASVFKGCNSLESITLPFIGESRKTASDEYQYPLGYLFGNDKTIYTYEVEQSYHYDSKYLTTTSTYCIPYKLKNITVTGGEILYGAFENCEYLETVDIKYGATKIGGSAFENCHKLTSVTIPNSVTEIGRHAFAYCYNLNWTIPDSVTSIGAGAFRDCRKFTTVNIPSAVTSIGTYAFSGCYSLDNVYFGDGIQLETIDNGTFSGCTALDSIVIPDGVTSIGGYAFRDCSTISSITIPSSVTHIGEQAFKGCPSILGGFKLIMRSNNCWKRSDPDNSTTYEYVNINNYTDDNLYEQFVMEPYVNYEWNAEEHAYGDWHVINEPNCITVGLKGKDCVNCGHCETEMIPISGEHTYNKSVVTAPTCTEKGYTTHICTVCGRTYIDSHVPALGHSYLPIVTPPTCTTKGYTTYTCTMCGDSYIDNFVPGTGHDWKDATCTDPKTCRTCGATEGSALGHIEVIDPAVEATCTTAGKTSGSHCSRCGIILANQALVPALGHLYEVTIKGPTCTEQGHDLYTCARCGDIYEDNFTAALGHNWVDATCTTPKTCSRCDATEGEALGHLWGLWEIDKWPTCTTAGRQTRKCTVCDAPDFEVIPTTNHITGDWIIDTEATTTSAGSKHKECSVCGTTVETAIIPKLQLTFTELDDGTYSVAAAHNGISGAIDIPSTYNGKAVTRIGDNAFYNCDIITSINIPDSITYIECYAFDNCDGLTSITIPNSVTKTDEGIFSNCSNLTSVTLGTGLKHINNEMFYNCSKLTSITIPDNITHIYEYAFYNCTSLTSVNLGNGVTYIDEHTFNGCSALASITIPGRVTYVGSRAFVGCTNLSITCGAASKPDTWDDDWNPDDRPVTWCDPLTYTLLSDGTYSVKAKDTSVSGAITIPSTYNGKAVTQIEDYAFLGCTNLTGVTLSSNLTKIDNGAFEGTGITSIHIPASVTYIGYDAFADSNLTSATAETKNWLLYNDWDDDTGYGTEQSELNISGWSAAQLAQFLVSELISESGSYENNYYHLEKDPNAIEVGTWQYLHSDVEVFAVELFDADSLSGYYGDQIIAGGYLNNNVYVPTPVLYKTCVNDASMVNEPDLEDAFFYVGTAKLGNATVDKWRKIELGNGGDSAFSWNSSMQGYIYTEVVVENNRFKDGVLY